MRKNDNTIILPSKEEIDIRKIAEKVVIFSNVSKNEGIIKLLQECKVVEVEAGNEFVSEGDEGDFAYIAISGELQISRLSLSGDNVVVASFHVDLKKVLSQIHFTFPLIGEQSFVGKGLKRTASVRALGKVVLLKIEHNKFLNVAEKYPEIGMYVYKKICSILQHRLMVSNSNVVALFEAYLDTLSEDLMNIEDE